MSERKYRTSVRSMTRLMRTYHLQCDAAFGHLLQRKYTELFYTRNAPHSPTVTF